MKQQRRLRQSLQQHRSMSDNLLGHNPMAQKVSSDKNLPKPKKKDTGPIIGVDSNTIGGGVWAQTSAKRDKLGELRSELKFDQGQRTLDDVASDEEQLDLHLVDGVRAVLIALDDKSALLEELAQSEEQLTTDDDCSQILQDFELILDQGEKLILEQGKSDDNSDQSTHTIPNTNVHITREQFNTHIKNLQDQLSLLKSQYYPASVIEKDVSTNPSTKTSSPLLCLRDFYPYEPPSNEKDDKPTIKPSQLQKDLKEPISQPLHQCQEYFTILHLESTLYFLSNQWDQLTKISDADVDRAATKSITLQPPTTVDLVKLHNILRAILNNSKNNTLDLPDKHGEQKGEEEGKEAVKCTAMKRTVKAFWSLIDRDNDGMLNQHEMDQVVHLALQPIERAFQIFIEESLDVHPLRELRPPPLQNDLVVGGQEELAIPAEEEKMKKGWYAKSKADRKEKRVKKTFLKLLNKCIKQHFEVEVELPHRLRCIYAWADKKHQDGKVESVLVEQQNENGGSFIGGIGKKRYVELDPKISYEEFLSVQEEHFAHLDRAPQELCMSLKEELWVHQGQRRQNKELRKEMMGFLFVVSLIDIVVTMN